MQSFEAPGCGTSLPDTMCVTALRVKSANLIELRACNAGTTNASFSGATFKLISLR